MDRLERESDVPPWYTGPKEAWRARLLLAEGDLEAASAWVQDQGLDVDGELTYLREEMHIAHARILAAQNKERQALRLLERLYEMADKGGRIATVAQIQMIRSLAHGARGEIEEALAALGQALALTEPGSYVRVYLDEGAAMEELLQLAAARGIAKDYADKLLAAFEADKAQERPPPAQDRLLDPLSGRELEVLRLLATELTGPEIARELSVSLNTMRTHTRNIYSKLGVHNRRSALSKAEDLELI